jgi:hypothetical protein
MMSKSMWLLHFVGSAITVSWLAYARQLTAAPLVNLQRQVQIECYQQVVSIPPEQRYACSVRVSSIADRDRWLIVPTLVGRSLKARPEVTLIQMTRGNDEVPSCVSLGAGDSFVAIPIPANRPLHIKKWVFRTIGEINNVKVWLGGELRLSNGITLSSVIKQLMAGNPTANDGSEPGDWNAPRGTTITFAPGGFQATYFKVPVHKDSAKKASGQQ